MAVRLKAVRNLYKMSDKADEWEDDVDELLLSIPLNNLQQISRDDAGEEPHHPTKRSFDEDGDEASASKEINKRMRATDDDTNKSSSPESSDIRATIQSINKSSTTPLVLYRRGGYLWVSDLCKQAWCEQQMEYGFTVPREVEEDPVIKAGTEFHLARELEVHDVVQVNVTSDEDVFAVKILNLLTAVTALINGDPVRREIPIFGAPFQPDVFMIGMIDEIRCDSEAFQIDIVELKTRQNNFLPSKAQKLTHDLQVMMYKKLFDDLITGTTTLELVTKHLKLDVKKEFGKDVTSSINKDQLTANNIGDLYTILLDKMASMPYISLLFIEYCYQADKSTIAFQDVRFDEAWLEATYMEYLRYWQGDREPIGVDIEDAWKCQKCDFADICVWRKRKADECLAKYKQTRSSSTSGGTSTNIHKSNDGIS